MTRRCICRRCKLPSSYGDHGGFKLLLGVANDPIITNIIFNWLEISPYGNPCPGCVYSDEQMSSLDSHVSC